MVVRLEHIGKRYAGGAPVLSDISLELDPGGFAVVTGNSGVGKTTLLNLIALGDAPSQGRLSLFGTDTASLDRAGRAMLRRRIGIIFQDLRLIANASVQDNVALPLRIAGIAEPQVHENVAELLTWLGLAARASVPVSALPQGERQLVAVARAIVGRPELLVADEPTGSLDADAAADLVRVFEQINRLGTTIIVATHNPSFAGGLALQRFHLETAQLSTTAAAANQ